MAIAEGAEDAETDGLVGAVAYCFFENNGFHNTLTNAKSRLILPSLPGRSMQWKRRWMLSFFHFIFFPHTQVRLSNL